METQFTGMLAQTLLLVAFMTALLCWVGPRYAPQIGLIDKPGGRKIHKHPTPLLGGLAIIFVFLPITVCLPQYVAYGNISNIYIMAFCTSGIAIIGLIDDCNPVSPVARLIAAAVFFTATAMMSVDFRINYIGWNGNSAGISLGYLATIASILSMLALINAINMADGKNGLVLGLSSGWLAILWLASPANIVVPIAILFVMVTVLLIFNLNGRLFLGDGGSYGIAAGIGLLAIYVYQKSDILNSADQVGLMFMIPVGDMIRLMIRRKRMGRSPFSADRDHFHHHLLGYFGWPRGLIIYLFVSLFPCIVSLAFPHYTLVIIAVTFIAYWFVIGLAHRHTSETH